MSLTPMSGDYAALPVAPGHDVMQDPLGIRRAAGALQVLAECVPNGSATS